jgi:hypothetical protein
MASTADSIRHLTRAHLGTRVVQGLVFWWVLMLHVHAVSTAFVRPDPRLQMWLLVAAVLGAATMGTYYRWRFGRVEPPRPSPWDRPFQGFKYGVVGATTLVLLGIVVFVFAADAGARPRDLGLVMFSGGTALSLANSLRSRQGQALAVGAAAVLLATLVVPDLRPYQMVGHLAMAAALVTNAVQLHRFLAREFQHVHV